MLAGSCAALIFDGLYASALTRREMPSQFRVGELYLLGISSTVDAASFVSMWCWDKSISSGEFSVR